MGRLLKRRQRIPLSEVQITTDWDTGKGGIYAVLYMDPDATMRPTVDIRWFNYNPKTSRHKSSGHGVILSSLAEVMDLAEVLVKFVEEAKALGLKDLEPGAQREAILQREEDNR